MISFEFVQVFENMQMRNNVETEEQLSEITFLEIGTYGVHIHIYDMICYDMI